MNLATYAKLYFWLFIASALLAIVLLLLGQMKWFIAACWAAFVWTRALKGTFNAIELERKYGKPTR